MRIIDAHCHLSDLRYEGRLPEVFARAADAGVDAFILGGVEPAEWSRQRTLIKVTPAALFSCFGLHPWIVDAHFENGALLEDALRQLPTFLADAKCVGLGELGLDHGPKRNPLSRSRQLEVFERQLELGEAFKKPLVLHIVHAHDEALECLKRKKPSRGGLVHAFSGSFETATRYLDLGFTISVGASPVQGMRPSSEH